MECFIRLLGVSRLGTTRQDGSASVAVKKGIELSARRVDIAPHKDGFRLTLDGGFTIDITPQPEVIGLGIYRRPVALTL